MNDSLGPYVRKSLGTWEFPTGVEIAFKLERDGHHLRLGETPMGDGWLMGALASLQSINPRDAELEGPGPEGHASI